MEEITLDGQRFEYELRGEGPLVVAVRNVAAPAGMWPTPGGIAALHDAGRSLLSYRHVGTTDTIEGIAADLARLLEHVDHGPAALWGWSQGAMTAQELALSRPDLVSCAVMMATRGRLTAYDRARYAIEAEIGSSPAGNLLGVMIQHAPDRLCDDDFFTAMMGGYGGTNPHAARANRAGMAYGDPSRLPALGGVTVPCMVVAFSHDVNIPPVLNREVADAIPGCEYVEIASAGHSGGITHRHELGAHVLPFLTR